MDKKTTILGIDPGLATTGYGILEKRSRKTFAVEWGVISTAKSDKEPKRLQIIASDLETLIKKFKPRLAVVENIFFAKNQKTAIAVAQARGVILMILYKYKIKTLELTPLQVKSKITSYGAASKQQVESMLKKLLNINHSIRPDDAADALALALCGSFEMKNTS